VLEYVHVLCEAVSTPGIRESAQINNMKKHHQAQILGNFAGAISVECE
jgi:hypothetical protein